MTGNSNMNYKMEMLESMVINADGLYESRFTVLDEAGKPTEIIAFYQSHDGINAEVAELRHGEDALDISNPSLPLSEIGKWIEAHISA